MVEPIENIAARAQDITYSYLDSFFGPPTDQQKISKDFSAMCLRLEVVARVQKRVHATETQMYIIKTHNVMCILSENANMRVRIQNLFYLISQSRATPLRIQ